MKRNRFRWMVLSGLVAVALVANNGRAQTDPPGITFLHLRATADHFELIDAKTVPGSLRSVRYDREAHGLHVEVLSKDNRTLFQTVCAEPTVRRLEYEDPSQPGRIVMKLVPSIPGDFTIRIPYSNEARMLRFYRHSSVATGVTLVGSKPTLVFQGQLRLPASP